MIDTHQLDYAGCIHDPVASIVLYGANHIVDTTIVNGKVVVEKGRLVQVNEEEVIDRANRLSKEFITRAAKSTGMDYSLVPLRQTE